MLTGAPSDALAPGPAEAGEGVADRLADFVRAARGAFSANTERAVRSDLAVWGAWCAARGVCALPAAPETVAGFVDAMAESRAPATRRTATAGRPPASRRSHACCRTCASTSACARRWSTPARSAPPRSTCSTTAASA